MSYSSITLLFTCLLIGSHFISPELKKIKIFKPYVITSFASGITVAYIFLHLLPSLVESHTRIHTLIDKTTLMSPFKDLIVFISALIGFEIFYFTEREITVAKGSAAIHQTNVFRFNLALYAIYNFFITYTLRLIDRAQHTQTLLYVIAIGLHFILSDNHFKRHFEERFNYKANLILVSALFLGWLASFIYYPGQLFVPALMTAMLSGSILYNAFTEEITLTRQTSIPGFFIGTLIMGSLLAIQLIH